jgi:hypothetical protein
MRGKKIILRKGFSLFLIMMLTISLVNVNVFVTPEVKVYARNVNSKLNNFITADGDKLKDGDKDFRFVSFDEPDLINDTPEAEVKDALLSTSQLGGQVTRLYVISVQKPGDTPDIQRNVSFDTKNNKLIFNEKLFRSLDRELALCNQYGIRLIIPLVDEWDWTGGIKEYAAFRGKSQNEFWTDPQVRNDFKQVINYILNRTNTVTGVKYKDDKAVLAWETGNEITPTDEWTNDIAAYIKSIDKNHLVLDGNQNVNDASLNNSNIDVVSQHFYKDNNGYNYANRISAAREKAKGKKPFIVGEFGLAPTSELTAAVNEVVNDGTSGILLWTLRFRFKDGGYHWDYEGPNYGGYHWPGSKSGDFFDERNVVTMMRDNAFKIQGLPVPPMPDISNETPVLKPITTLTNISWIGVTPAQGYDVERADSPHGPWTVVGTDITDEVDYNLDMFHDTTAKTGGTYYYRVIGKNETSKSKYSNIVKVQNAKHIFIDDDFTDAMGRLNKAYSETNGLTTSYIGSDKTLVRKNLTNEKVVYASPKDIKNFKVVTYFKDKDAVADFTFELSSDNKNYHTVIPSKTNDVDGWDKVTYSLDKIPAGMRFIKISFPNAYDDPTIPQIGRVQYEYYHDGGPLTEVTPSNEIMPSSPAFTDTIDDFEGYNDNTALNTAYTQNGNGGNVTVSLDTQNKNSGNNGLKYDYNIAGVGNVGVSKNLNGEDLSPYSALRLWLKPDGSNRNLTFQFKTGKGYCFEANYQMTDTTAKIITIPLSDFKLVSSEVIKGENPVMDLDNMQGFNINISGDKGTGTVYFDDIQAVMESKLIDDFEGYNDNTSLNAAYTPNLKGDNVTLALDSQNKNSGNNGLKYDYTIGANGNAGVTKSLNGENFSLCSGLQLWLKPDGSNRNLTFQLKTGKGYYFQANYTMSDSTPKIITIPFSEFKQAPWQKKEGLDPQIDLDNMQSFSINVAGSKGASGSVYFDDIKAVLLDKNIENFEEYKDNTALNQAFVANSGGDPLTLSLDNTNKFEGNAGLDFNYNLGAKGYAGATLSLNSDDWSRYNALQFWVKEDGSGKDLTIQFEDANNEYREAVCPNETAGEKIVTIPFTAFHYPSWFSGGSGKLALNGVQQISLYIGGSPGEGNIYFDDIKLVNDEDLTGLQEVPVSN